MKISEKKTVEQGEDLLENFHWKSELFNLK